MVSAQLSLASTISATRWTPRSSTVAAQQSTVKAEGDISLTAADTSTIDSIAIGFSAAGLGAAGAATSENDIQNTITARIDQSYVESEADVSSTPIPRP